MKRFQSVTVATIIMVFILFCLFGCFSDDQRKTSQETEAPSEAQIALSTTEYTLDSLWSDLLKYCCEQSESRWYSFYLNGSIKYLKDNASAEKLVNKELLSKMEEKGISSDSVFDLVKLFSDSSFMVWDEIHAAYKQLYVEELDRKSGLSYGFSVRDQTENAFYQKMCQAIKQHLKDPNSLYFTFEPSEYIGDHLKIDLYVHCKNGDTSYYIDSEGKYTSKIYFYVAFSARNGYGGYNTMGAWLTYDEYDRIQWTGITGGSGEDAKYYTSFKLYGDNKELDYIGSFYIHKDCLTDLQ